MADMKGITCCGDCFYYDWNKKRCKRGASKDDDPKGPFFVDCPLPSVEPERPKGRWVYETNYGFVCSNCGGDIPQKVNFCRGCYMDADDVFSNFCPSCSADMRGESDGC